ncbi:MAG: T9SS type A sorting domain-containing protein [Bacteroidales bacterium]|nr:T9SS type A sorting domain-containing protein [Bacteroidales bacterium]
MDSKKTVFLSILFSFLSSILFVNAGNNSLNYAIGDSIHAINYEIHLENIDCSAKTISAFTKVKLTPKVDNLDFVNLQLKQLTVDSLFVENEKIMNFSHENTLLTIPLINIINIGDTIDVLVYYQGEPYHESWGGIHFSGEYMFNLGVAISDIPHNLGKAWFPCVDDFTDRATYDVFVTVEDEKTAVGGGVLIEEINNGNNTHTFHWAIDNNIPTYLASVAVGEYAAIRDTFYGMSDTIPIDFFVRPVDSTKVNGSFTNLKDILEIYENYMGPYPWKRVGYIGTSKGAMEHVTNIAYPNFCITGNSSYESLYAHEVSHMWVGDNTTCASAEDMWINEGWAVFFELFYTRDLYGEETFRELMRDKHTEILLKAHFIDHGYWALNNVPQEYTYGTTVYDKGATVVQSLRGYLGDELFFNTVKAYLQEFKYKSVSSFEMCDFMSTYTGIDMSGFFEAWVYTGGTPHFSIDSFAVDPNGSGSDYIVYVRQKFKGVDFLANSNIVEITFMDEDWNMFSDTIHFSGKTGCSVIEGVPFIPEIAMLDYYEKLCDATTDMAEVIKTNELINFENTYFKLDVVNVTDSAFVRMEHNWAPPDTLNYFQPGLTLSDYRYWKIDGIWPDDFQASGLFQYSKNGYLDNNLITNMEDSLVILYRPNPSEEWFGINFSKPANPYYGYITVENLQKGEYTLAIWDHDYVGINDYNTENKNSCKISPNPSSEEFIINFDFDNASEMRIYNSTGKFVESIGINKNQKSIKYLPRNLSRGVYFLRIISDENKILINKKLIIK